ncbi:MAG TPA: PorV/PorQ family protein [Bacteroidetes bacterium]|nr:PorV/PorQ family protein [Bacteroidota bacterium]
MKTFRHVTLALALVPVVVAAGLAQNVNYAGTSVANFLKVSPVARNTAMGEAPMAGGSGAAGTMYNPAAIAAGTQGSVTFATMRWLVDTRITYIAASYPMPGIGTFGVDIDYFGSGEMEETTLGDQDGTGRFFSASDLMLGGTYAANLTDRFAVGLKLKYVHENLSAASASAFAFDLGSTFRTSFLHEMVLSATLANFGSKMKFTGRDLEVIYEVPGSPSGKEVPAVLKTESWDLPLLFRFGAETDLLRWDRMRLHLAYSILDSRDHVTRQHLGAEYSYNDFVFLRGGYRFGWDEASWSAGFGLNLRVPNMGRMMFDYAVADWGIFDLVHQFTVGFRF